MSERFYIRESEGFKIRLPACETHGKENPILEVMVLDREQNHEVVRSFESTDTRFAPKKLALWLRRRETLRERARELAAELNAWHERELERGGERVDSGTNERPQVGAPILSNHSKER